jgi:nitrate/nitrite transporter NarK
MLQGNLVASLVAMSIASIGISSATPLFFTLVSEYLAAGVAAVGIAMISSLGNLGPAVTPYLNGLILKSTGSNAYGLYMIIVMYVLAGILLLVTVRPARNAPQGAG